MVDLNYSLFIQIFNFLFLLVVLNFLLYRPLRGMIKERREKFQGYESDIDGLDKRVSERLTEMEAFISSARRDGFQKKDELKGKGQEQEKHILAAATGQAEAEIEKTTVQIKTEVAAARDALRVQVEAFSLELAQKILGRSLS